MLTRERLKQLLHYNPDTGLFTRLVRVTNCVQVGDVAGGDDCGKGYWFVGVDGRRYLAHRLAWLYMTGAFPENQIDHKNHIKSDNRWLNLRDVTNQTNSQNRDPLKCKSKTGLFGVFRYGKRGKFKAEIRFGGRQVHLGVFDKPADAYQAYLRAKRLLHEGNTL